jgi:hypothetical protein
MRLVRKLAAAAACLSALAVSPASAEVLVQIDKSTQTMTVSEDGARLYNWPVSTGIARYDTPSGSFKPFRMERHHFSREWDDAPMPNSIFFTTKGHAIHGTAHTSIGRPASHGCVRLSVANSRILFDLVKREGMANTRVVLSGEIPPPAPQVARRAPGYGPQNYRPRSYTYGPRGPYADDEDVTGSVPQRRVYRDDRPVYWGRPPGPPDDDGYDQPAPPLPPPPFFLPFGPRPGWN